MLILKAPQSEVLAAVQRVAGVTPSRSTLVVMTNLLLRKAGDVLSLTASDLDVQATTTANLGGESGDFATTVSAKRLADVLKVFAADQVVSLSEKDGKLTLQGGKSRFTMQTIPAAEFPVMKPADGETEVKVPQRVLLGLLEQVAFAMAVHDVRYFLCGAFIAADGEAITAVASDGTHMVKVSAPAASPACEFIIPRPSVLHLVKMLGATDDEVAIRLTRNLATFDFSGMQFITKLIDGKYVPWKRAIPANLPQAVTLGRKPLLHALRSVAVMTSTKFQHVLLKFFSGSLQLSAKDGAEDAENELEIDYGGPTVEIGFNAKLLGEGLSSVDDEMVRLEFGPESAICMSLPNGDASLRYVISPLRA